MRKEILKKEIYDWKRLFFHVYKTKNLIRNQYFTIRQIGPNEISYECD